MRDVAGKLVVITGAGSGIGRALALNLARRGARLALSDLDAAGLAETVRLVAGTEVRHDLLDVRDRAAMAGYAASIAEQFAQVDVVINNAGVALTGSVLDLDYAEDSTAYVDFNIVMTDRDEFVEIQGTAERFPFSTTALNQLIDLGRLGIGNLIELQRKTLQGL